MAEPGSLPATAPGGISMNRMLRYGKKNTEAESSTKTGRFMFSVRRLVQRSPTSPGPGASNRSASIGCSFMMWSTAFRITAMRWLGARVQTADVQPGRSVRSGVVEVDHQADLAARDPDPDPDPVVGRVHQVDVVATGVRPLALEEQVRAEDRGARTPRPAADVLGPAIAR